MNPIIAGLVEHPVEYQWSSHRAYLGLVETPWLTTSFALSMLSDDPAAARKLFLEFFADANAERELPTIDEWPPESSDRPIQQQSSLAEVKTCEPLKPPVDLEALIDQVAARYDVTRQELESKSKRRRTAQARAEIARQAQDLEIATLSDVARKFGRATATLSRSVAALRERVRKEIKASRSGQHSGEC